MVESGRGFSKRRGSALLIVMGMFAFMIVSAVSFSVYMRSSRKPSSFVRRNALTRQIVRAAMARAIDEVDTAIGNDPFPGFGKNHVSRPDATSSGGNALGLQNDDWVGRVFSPSNLCSRRTTVPTLTLEALGYLPPPLINEVRYGSRHTRTAQWRSFNYGLGRYAFTAVNVSDFFDLTALVDDQGRPLSVNRSSAPHTRITPAYLFSKAALEQNDGARYDDFSKPNACKDFYENLTNKEGLDQVPLVSMMDYNLALGRYLDGSGLEAPFYKTIHGDYSPSMVFSYDDRKRISPQMFIAGGWDGSDSSTVVNPQNYIDLQDPRCQPLVGHNFPKLITFENADHNTDFWKRRAALNTRPNRGSRNASLVENCLPVLTQRLLADYLDYDSVPISLAYPGAEETPMVVYAELNDDCVKWELKANPTFAAVPQPPSASAPAPGGAIPDFERTYSLSLKIDADVILGTVYPFQYLPRNGKTYTVECFLRVFFTADTGDVWEKGLRTGNADLMLETGTLKDGSFRWNGINGNERRPAYVQLRSGTQAVNARDADVGAINVAEQSAVQQLSPLNCSWQVDIDLAKAIYTYPVAGVNAGTAVAPVFKQVDPLNDMVVFDSAWASVDQTKIVTQAAFDELQAPSDGLTIYRPSVALWVRIKDSDDNTVDMVPATPSYDNVDGPGKNRTAWLDDSFFDAAGGGTPLLRFFPKQDGDSEIQFNWTFFQTHTGEKGIKLANQAYAANDPRYNWAPEDWTAFDNGADPRDAGWLAKVRTFQDARPRQCDPDIFMQVSDQGYLQSMYELMMIPQVEMIKESDAAIFGRLECAPYNNYNGVRRTAFENTLHADLMWRTYRSDAFWQRNNEGDLYYENDQYRIWGSIEDIGFVESTEGMRVNPYTDITNLFAGALANMPRDWWSAGTNFNDTTGNWAGKKAYMNSQDDARLKVKDEYLMDFTRKDVMEMARFMMAEFRHDETEANIADTNRWESWSEAMDYWNWPLQDTRKFGDFRLSSVDEYEMNLIMEEMKSVDRKFMFGYLKGCFGNKSQLFLIFVRAEPSDGGGGGRAVALVWRDPNAETTTDNADLYLQKTQPNNPYLSEETWRLNSRHTSPHRTRILFYRQFE